MSLGDTMKRVRHTQLNTLTVNSEDYMESMLPFNVGDAVKFLHQPPISSTGRTSDSPTYYDEKCGIITEIVQVGGVPGSGNFWAHVKVVWKLKTGRVSIPITRFWHEDESQSAIKLLGATK